MDETGTFTREVLSCGKWYTQQYVIEDGRTLVVSEEPRKPHRLGCHAAAMDARGRSIPDKIWGWEMPVLADFPSLVREGGDWITPDLEDSGLAQAREWAAKIFKSDERAAYVEISGRKQEFESQGWTYSGHISERIERPA